MNKVAEECGRRPPILGAEPTIRQPAVSGASKLLIALITGPLSGFEAVTQSGNPRHNVTLNTLSRANVTVSQAVSATHEPWKRNRSSAASHHEHPTTVRRQANFDAEESKSDLAVSSGPRQLELDGERFVIRRRPDLYIDATTGLSVSACVNTTSINWANRFGRP